jgi:hypothetical protein
MEELGKNDELDLALNFLRIIKEESSKDERYGFEDEWNIFIKKMQFLSPKSFGTRIQNRIIDKNNFVKNSPFDNKGDFKIDNQYFEFKTSLITTSNRLANFVNIRPYQSIDGYYCLVVDTNKTPYLTSIFKLTKDQMNFELEILKANSSNGTKTSNQENKNVSLRFSIDLSNENENQKRWNSNYLTNLLHL